MDDAPTPGRNAHSPPPPPQPSLAKGQCTEKLVPLLLEMVPTGMRLELTKSDIIMGRHSSADIRLPLADVSRVHCRFVCADNCWQVIDLNSLNGVWVNNQRVRQKVLQHGDRIRIGGFLFQALFPDASTRIEARRAS